MYCLQYGCNNVGTLVCYTTCLKSTLASLTAPYALVHTLLAWACSKVGASCHCSLPMSNCTGTSSSRPRLLMRKPVTRVRVILVACAHEKLRCCQARRHSDFTHAVVAVAEQTRTEKHEYRALCQIARAQRACVLADGRVVNRRAAQVNILDWAPKAGIIRCKHRRMLERMKAG